MNNWKKPWSPTGEEVCRICGTTQLLQTHHMLHGNMRKAADKYGLTCKLCVFCHTELHDHGLFDRELQQEAQRRFEENHSHEEFMAIFGKNFL
jgi:hypothetical protein